MWYQWLLFLCFPRNADEFSGMCWSFDLLVLISICWSWSRSVGLDLDLLVLISVCWSWSRSVALISICCLDLGLLVLISVLLFRSSLNIHFFVLTSFSNCIFWFVSALESLEGWQIWDYQVFTDEYARNLFLLTVSLILTWLNRIISPSFCHHHFWPTNRKTDYSSKKILVARFVGLVGLVLPKYAIFMVGV